MDSATSQQPIIDAIGTSPDGSAVDPSTLNDINFQSNSAAVDAALGGGGGLSFNGITSSLATIPTWVWLVLGGAIIFKMVR